MATVPPSLAKLQAAAGTPAASAPSAPAAPAAPSATPAPPAAVAPQAPAAPSAPPERLFWVYENGQSIQQTASQVQAKLDAGAPATLPVMADGETAWSTPAAYGFIPVKVAEVVRTAPAAPAAATPVAPAAPAAPAAPLAPAAPSASRAVTTGAAPGALPALIQDDDEAMRFLATLDAPISAPSLASVVDDIDSAGGMSHSLPFAQIRTGNWSVAKQIPIEQADHLPMGNRDWTAVYLTHRIAVTGWVGAGSKGSGGNPPIYKYALPHLTMAGRIFPGMLPEEAATRLLSLTKQTLEIARNVQFTPGDRKVKFDGLGRLTVETQILCWRPSIGFCLLVAPGFKTTEETLARLATADTSNWARRPCVFSLKETSSENKRVMKEDPGAKNASWTDHYVETVIDTTPRGAELMAAFDAFKERDRVSIANALMVFMQTQDFTGLSIAEVEALLPKYAEIPPEPRAQRR